MLLFKQTLFQRLSSATSAHQRTVQTASFNSNSNRYFQAIKTLNICRVEISPEHKLSHSANTILTDTSHVLRGSLLHRYKDVISGRYNPREEGLWIMCTSNTMPGPKVVRGWARRRISQALVEELKGRGFDRKGKRLERKNEKLGEMGQEEENDVPEVIVGTVAIETLPRSLQVKYEEVQRQAALMAEEILRICGRKRRGRPRVKRPLLDSKG